MALSYIALGSNIGDRPAHIHAALKAIAHLGTLRRHSSLYRTAPWGKTDQPDFINAVALLETDLPPQALLAELKVIETQLGRVAGERWGPRAIDLDIITYDDITIESPELQIPHPHFQERAFVLIPLAEIDPAYEKRRDAIPLKERQSAIRLP